MANEKTKNCPNCTARNPANYTFCHHCRLTPADCKAAAGETSAAPKTSAAKKSSAKRASR